MTNDKQRERLVELLRAVEEDATITCPRYKKGNTLAACIGCQYNKEDGSCDYTARKADYLLADGWMRPPCKVGDKVYIVAEVSKQIVECTVIGVWIYENDCMIITDCGTIHNLSFGITVFATKEEAEEALKGGVQG